jgi:hypothetical protein
MEIEDDRVAPYKRLERFGKASWWALGLVLLIAVAFYLLQRFGSFILPSLVGIVLATTLSPVVGWMERHRVPRIVGAIIVSLLVVLVLVAIAWAAVVIVVDQSAQIWHTLTEASARIDRWLGGSGPTPWPSCRRSSPGCGRARPAECCPLLSRESASCMISSSRSSSPAASASSSSGRDRW